MAAVAVSIAALAGCSSDDSDDSTDSSSPAAECGGSPTGGALKVPTESTALTKGQATFQATFAGDSTVCVTAKPSTGMSVAAWAVDAQKTSFDFNTGDADSGLMVSFYEEVRDPEHGLPVSLPGEVPDPFVGVRVEGVYYRKGANTVCHTTATALSADLVSGRFECVGPMVSARKSDESTSPSAPKAKILMNAKGWFVASR